MTGTASGSRNTPCFSVCYRKRKCKPSESEFAAGSLHPRPLGDSLRASEETAAQERSGDVCQGAGDANLQVHPLYYSAPAWFVLYTLPSRGSWFFPASASVSLCVTLRRTQPPPVSLLRAPAILPLQFHIGKALLTNLGSSWPFTSSFRPCSYTQQELLAAEGLTGVREGITGKARTI